MSLDSSAYASLTNDDANVTRKLSVLKHRKKAASNDAQLLMNRIALLQKEEERARKKINHTKDRVEEIMGLRASNESKMKAFNDIADEQNSLKDAIQKKNKAQEAENRKNIQIQTATLLESRKGTVSVMRDQRKKALKSIVKEQQDEVKRKQKKRLEIRRQEEEARKRKEAEKAAQDRKVREEFERKAAAEEAEAKRAEKLVKALEKKEREWIERLRLAQKTQEDAFEYLEETLTVEGQGSPNSRGSPSRSIHGAGADDVRASTTSLASASNASTGGNKPKRKNSAKGEKK